MVIVETTRGPFRLVELYYARQPEEIRGLRDSVALNRIVYIRQAPRLPEVERFAAWYRPTATILVDLTRGLEELFAEASSTCRRQIRKTDRISNRLEIHRNDSSAYGDFLKLYNGFVAHSRHSEPLSKSRLDALRHLSDFFVAYFDGRPLCGHVMIRDQGLGRVGLLLSASTRLDGKDTPILIGSINRWLHWHEVQFYKSEGMLVYDLGGAGTETPRTAGIARFKRSFGGTQVTEHNYIAAKPVARIAIALFYAMRRMRSIGTTGDPSGANGFMGSGWTKIRAGSSRRLAIEKQHDA
jgi:Acetyltransferase (GNAT) domain